MKVTIVGAGHIGGNLAYQLAKRGYEVTITFSRDSNALQETAKQIGNGCKAVADPAVAKRDADVIIVAIPWRIIDTAMEALGNVSNKYIIDTSNQFGAGELDSSAAAFNQKRFGAVNYAKAFNTLTSGYQRAVGNGEHGEVAMFYATESETMKSVAEQIISATGFMPVLIGGWDKAEFMEPPHRYGAVYGEAYSPADAQRIVEAFKTKYDTAAELANDLKL
jgi:8-hydroxy-5-deazaflavin:NADPH oxidoreductase